MNAKPFLVLAGNLLAASTAALGGDAAPLLVVRPQVVAQAFPVEGLVEAVHQTTVGAQVAGRVLEVRADAGQAVRKGELLMRLDAREAAEAERAADAQYRNASLAYARSQRLKEQKFVSQAAVDRARAELDAASAGRAAAAAGRSHAAIVAPISGLIARRHAEPGDMATPGKPLFTIYEPGNLRVTVSVPQSRLAGIRAVRTARVEFPELGKWIEATAVRLLPTADAATHVAQVRVSLPAVPEAMPGMFARVHFVLGAAEKLTVPTGAVVRRGEVAAVYVHGADGRPSLRQLRLGEPVDGGAIEVLAGLAAGDQVVSDPVKAGIQLKSAAR